MDLSKEEMRALGTAIKEGSTPGSLYSYRAVKNLKEMGLIFKSARGYYRPTPEGKAMYELLTMVG